MTIKFTIQELSTVINWLDNKQLVAQFHPLMKEKSIEHFYLQQALILDDVLLKLKKKSLENKNQFKINISQIEAISLHEFLRNYPLQPEHNFYQFTRNYLLGQLNIKLQ